MKALNVYQPWAELIIQGRKGIELRKRRTSHRGPLAIRATRTVLEWACQKYGLPAGDLATGAIVGVVEVVEVVELTPERWAAERDQHLNEAPSPGIWRYGWRVQNPRRLPEPLRCRALPGMFTLPADIAEKLAAA